MNGIPSQISKDLVFTLFYIIIFILLRTFPSVQVTARQPTIPLICVSSKTIHRLLGREFTVLSRRFCYVSQTKIGFKMITNLNFCPPLKLSLFSSMRRALKGSEGAHIEKQTRLMHGLVLARITNAVEETSENEPRRVNSIE